MDLTSLQTIKVLCRKYGILPQKQRGQNFLIDRNILEKIIKAADLKKDDIVLEIGPGFGALTAELAGRVKKVVAVEADRRLADALRKILAEHKNIEIIEADILKFPISNFQFSNYGYKIVANLPYQITSAVFRKFLEQEPRPGEMTLMVQKEVAERICAKTGKMSLLSISVQFFGKPEIVEAVSRKSFWPEPEIDSAILKISDIKSESEANLKKIQTDFSQVRFDATLVALKKKVDLEKFFRIVKIGFSARRKQLHNNLSAGLRLPSREVQDILIKLGFDQKIRAQDLSVEDWISLAKQLYC